MIPARHDTGWTRFRVAVLATAALIPAILLAGCGDPAGAGSPTPAPLRTSYSAAERAGHSDLDVDFAQMMLVHTRQSTDLVELARERSDRADVLALADELAASDAEIIEAMSALLDSWGEETPDEIVLTEMDHSEMDHASIGMGFMAGISDDQVTLLNALDGPEFDAKFLKFILIHRGAGVAMAQSERLYGQSGAATKIAKELESGQGADMQQIEELRRPG